LLSPRGSVSIDVRTNTLIIQDIPKKIDEIRELIAKLDVPVKQVMIEARIVTASSSFTKELGVKWGVAHDNIGQISVLWQVVHVLL
jgi:type IV pilus assembly protein PilQ